LHRAKALHLVLEIVLLYFARSSEQSMGACELVFGATINWLNFLRLVRGARHYSILSYCRVIGNESVWWTHFLYM